MFKNTALAAIITLGFATAASASNYDLAGFEGFGQKTATPKTPVSMAINWDNIFENENNYDLAGFEGFGQKTATPVSIVSDNIDWDNIAGLTVRSQYTSKAVRS